jgi:DNA-binding CsgD family transcriptional regulator
MLKSPRKWLNIIYIPTVVVILVSTQVLVAFSMYAATKSKETPKYVNIFGAVFSALFLILNIVVFAIYINTHTQVPMTTPLKTKDGGVSDAFTQKFGITPREREVISLILLGKTNKEMAIAFNLSEDTIKTHTKNIYRKTGVSGRFALQSLLCS